MKKFLALTFFLLIPVINAAAQDKAVADLKRSELTKVEKMVGNWKGTGWIQQGPNRETFTGSEMVQNKVGGLALLVEGKFTNPEGKVIHETLAAIAYDDKSKSTRMRTYLASGIAGEYEIKTLPDSYEWGFETGQGTVKYTIRVDAEKWNEVGEFSRDGKTWMKFFEMNLAKVK